MDDTKTLFSIPDDLILHSADMTRAFCCPGPFTATSSSSGTSAFTAMSASAETLVETDTKKGKDKTIVAPVGFHFLSLRACDDTQRLYHAVCFPLTYGGKITKRLVLIGAPCTEKEALLQAERYLSEPLDQKYYESIKEDGFHTPPWVQAQKWWKSRGDCLGPNVLVVSMNRDEPTQTLTVTCGHRMPET